MKYLVILPVFNEEMMISPVIGEIKQNIPHADILAVNDGSGDRTGPPGSAK